MQDGPVIARIAALLGDPARANMLTALMDGRALTVSELAEVGGISLPTASGHLSRLAQAGLVAAERQGRSRYYRLTGADVGEVLEGLMSLAQRTGSVRVRTGPRDPALRRARICYDHLAGAAGVALMDGLIERGWLTGEDAPQLTAQGRAGLAALGLPVEQLVRGRRPLCRRCLDWSERRGHLGGALGAAVLENILATGHVRRTDSRVIVISVEGEADLARRFGARWRAEAVL